MRLAPLVLAMLCVAVLFSGLDRIGLTDAREARDSQVARELVESREVLTPLFGQEPLFEKPVLAYAPEAVARMLPESRDLRSRQLRAMIAVLLLILIASVAAQHFGLRAAVFSAAVLATSLALPLASRTDSTQLIATLFGWLGCAGLSDALFGRRAGSEVRLVVTYAALAGALLCAGPLPALWPLGAVAFYSAVARDSRGWKRVHPVPGLVFMAGLALPWYGAMTERYGALFLAHAPIFPYGVEPRGPWFAGALMALTFLIVGFFPWSTLLPGALLHAATWWRKVRSAAAPAPGIEPSLEGMDPVSRERREESAAHFFVAALLAALVPIAFYPTAPLPAALPALPAAALLCGRFLDHLFEDAARVSQPLARATGLLAVFGSVAAVLLTVASGRVRGAAPEIRLLASVMLVTTWAPFLANFIGRRRAAAILMTLPVALGTPIATMRLLPAMAGYLNTREVAVAMSAVAPPRAPLVLLEPPPPSLRLYAQRNFVVDTPLAAALHRGRAGDGLTYLAFRPSREHDAARAAPEPLEILLRTPSLVLARVHSGDVAPVADTTSSR